MRAIILSLAAPGEGGLGAAALDMADGLTGLGIDVEHITPGRNTLGQGIASRRPLRRLPQLRRELDRRAIVRRLPREWQFAYSMPGLLPPRGPGVRVLHQATRHPRNVRVALAKARAAGGGGRGFMTRQEATQLEEELLKADLVRVESQAVYEELVEAGLPRERLVHAYPGVDLDLYRAGERPDHLQVAFVGPLSLWKGLDIVSDIAKRLGRGEVLGMAGGPVCPWSRRLVAATPHVRCADARALIAASHALVLPSASDGFGRVVLEAMASETVPFVSPEVGAAEIVGRIDSRLVQPRESFAEAVVELLRSLPLPTLGRRAEEIATEFDRTRRVPEAAAWVVSAASLSTAGAN